MRTTGLILVVCAALRAAQAGGGDSHLQLRVLAASTRRVLDGFQCGLVDPQTREIYARFKTGSYAGQRKPKPGDLLYVYLRGYDVARVELTGQRALEVLLRPRTGRATLVLEGPGVERVPWKADIMLTPPGPWRRGPVSDFYTYRATGPRLEIEFAAGMRAEAVVQTANAILWPLHVGVPDGQVVRFHYVPPRLLTVKKDDDFKPERATYFVDYLWQPEAPPREVDAWRWAINRPWWLEQGFFAGGTKLRLSPDIPFHVFAVHRGLPFYRHVGLQDGSMDLTGGQRFKRVASRPVVDGKPVLAGTLIAAGRLDTYTIASLWELRRNLGGCCFRIGSVEDWSELTLPESDWLTTWHSRSGICHMRWMEGIRPAGKSYPYALEVAFPQGVASGTLSVFPSWRSSGGVKATPADAGLRRKFTKTARVRFPGLRAGQYGMDIQVEITSGAGPVGMISRMTNVIVLTDRQTTVIPLAAK